MDAQSNNDGSLVFTTNDDSVNVNGNKIAALVHDTALRIVSKAIDVQVPKISQEIAEKAVVDADKARQRSEDQRANRRNRNRSYTLVVALVMTFCVPYVVANILHDTTLLKYATGIAIFPDALITAYAWIRHY